MLQNRNGGTEIDAWQKEYNEKLKDTNERIDTLDNIIHYGSVSNAVCFDGRTYVEAKCDILSAVPAVSNAVCFDNCDGDCWRSYIASQIPETAENSTCFAGLTCANWIYCIQCCSSAAKFPVCYWDCSPNAEIYCERCTKSCSLYNECSASNTSCYNFCGNYNVIYRFAGYDVYDCNTSVISAHVNGADFSIGYCGTCPTSIRSCVCCNAYGSLCTTEITQVSNNVTVCAKENNFSCARVIVDCQGFTTFVQQQGYGGDIVYFSAFDEGICGQFCNNCFALKEGRFYIKLYNNCWEFCSDGNLYKNGVCIL